MEMSLDSNNKRRAAVGRRVKLDPGLKARLVSRNGNLGLMKRNLLSTRTWFLSLRHYTAGQHIVWDEGNLEYNEARAERCAG